MPNLKWSMLSSMQLGTYAEYYAKMEFASYGFDVYTSEVDDHGVDFVAKNPEDNLYYEIQVKSVRNAGYIFINKSKMEIGPFRLVVLLIFHDGKLPEVYVIPSTRWNQPDEVFVEHLYDKPGQKSSPEWGVNISKKNRAILSEYISENYFHPLVG